MSIEDQFKNEFPAVKMQLARDGRWSEATTIVDNYLPVLDRLFHSADASLGFEVLFYREGHLQGIVGLRSDKLLFDQWNECVLLARSLAYSPKKVLAALVEKVETRDKFNQAKFHHELGVFGQWFDVGVYSGPFEQSKLFTADLPTWMKTGASDEIMLETIYECDSRFWWSDIVSKNRNGIHYISHEYFNRVYAKRLYGLAI